MIRKSHNLKRKRPFCVIFMSLLFAYFIDIKCMNCIFSAFGFVFEGSSILALQYFIVIGLIFAIGFRYNNQVVFSAGFNVIAVLIYCILLYIITIAVVGKPTVSFSYFLVFTLAAFCIPSSVCIDLKLVIKAIMIFPIIGILNLQELFIPENEYSNTISMGESYAFLVPVIANIIYLKFYFKNDAYKVPMLVVSVVNIIYLLYLVTMGSRGPLICIIGLFVFITLLSYKPLYGISIHKKRCLICIVGFAIIFLFIDKFLLFLLNVFNSIGIESYAIQKFISLSQSGDITNGRNIIYNQSWDGIFNSPFIGNGFDQFFNNTGSVYPHNSVLQVLYDGGLLFSLILLLPVIVFVIKKYKVATRNSYILLTFFLFAGFVSSMFSDNLWMQPMFWLFSGIVLTKNQLIYEK